MRGVTLAIALLAFVLICFLTFGRRLSTAWISSPSIPNLDTQNGHLNSEPLEIGNIVQWQKPAGMKVIGLVFYGRRQFVSILDCYLKVHHSKRGSWPTLTLVPAEKSGQERWST